jgi:glycerate dehydrogenase
MSHRIVFLDRATIAPQIRVRPPSFAHELIEHAETRADQVVERLAGASIAITNKAPITAATLERLPALKLVAVAATGTDCVDKAACAARGVAVSNIRGYAISTVPEHTFALILALRRNIVAYRQSVLAGRWQESGQFCFFDHPIRDLRGARLGIMGEGVLGQRVAELGKAFGMVPMFAAHKGRSGLGPLYTPWQEVLETSDVITLHSPLTKETRGMIAMPEFEAMKRRPLINQHRARRLGRRRSARACARRRAGRRRRLRRGRRRAAQARQPADARRRAPQRDPHAHVAWASREGATGAVRSIGRQHRELRRRRPTNLVEGAY